MADECTDVTTIEEVSNHFVEDGQPVEHFLEIVPLKATNAKTIYSALIKFMKDKNMQISKHVGMGFDRAAAFSGSVGHQPFPELKKEKVRPHCSNWIPYPSNWSYSSGCLEQEWPHNNFEV